MPAPGQHHFSEKVALVTDAASPIGRAVSIQLGLYGCYVIGACVAGSSAGDPSTEELRSLGTLAHSLEADTSSVEGVRSLADEVDSLFGRLDLLVNCLQVESNSKLVSVEDAEINDVLSRIVKPAYLLTREVIRFGVQRPGFRIVNVVRYDSDLKEGAGILGAAANAAVEGMTSTLANFLDGKFRLNTVAVREAASNKSEEVLDSELFRSGSSVDPDDVARTVLFLLSSEAKGMNGQVLNIG